MVKITPRCQRLGLMRVTLTAMLSSSGGGESERTETKRFSDYK